MSVSFHGPPLAVSSPAGSSTAETASDDCEAAATFTVAPLWRAAARRGVPRLTGCVCSAAAPLRCGLGCCSRTVGVIKAAANTHIIYIYSTLYIYIYITPAHAEYIIGLLSALTYYYTQHHRIREKRSAFYIPPQARFSVPSATIRTIRFRV